MKSSVDLGQRSGFRSGAPLFRSSPRAARPALSLVALGDYEAASVDGHVAHAADRFAATRSCLAATPVIRKNLCMAQFLRLGRRLYRVTPWPSAPRVWRLRS